MAAEDETKAVLQDLLAGLYAEQAQGKTPNGDSYLIGHDGKYLGKLTENAYDSHSILNKYGPFGSEYSPTSIFNPYSMYGSVFGQFSVNNPYTTTPPKIVLGGQPSGYVTKNPLLKPRISVGGLTHLLQTNPAALLAGQWKSAEFPTERAAGESYIAASDGTFLGNLRPNKMDRDSIFNKFGPYGNKYSQISILNPYGPYGSRYAIGSVNNPLAVSPPQIFKNGKMIFHLTKNRRLKPRLDPDEVFTWAEANVSAY